MTGYVITDGHGSYLKRDAAGSFLPVKNSKLADIYEQRAKANNILNNCVTRNLRKRYHIKTVDITDGIAEKESNPSNSLKQNAKETNEDNPIIGLIAETVDTDAIEKWLKEITSLSDFAIGMEKQKEELVAALSTVDREISDINHYIEFRKLNGRDGWKAYSMLRERLRKRRVIKNELIIVTQLGECKIDSKMLTDLKGVINQLKDRVYQARELTELFI